MTLPTIPDAHSRIPADTTIPADTDRLIDGVFEPPNGFALTAIARHKRLVCAITVLLAILGAGYGLSRKRTYTASATLQVGQVNPNSPGFFGYIQSAASLATAFSRAIEAEPVLKTVEHKLRIPATEAISRLSAEPLPTAPAFRVIGTGSTEVGSIKLTNVAAAAVIAYEGQSNNTNPEATSLLREYQEASLDFRRAVASVARQRKDAQPLSSLEAAEANEEAAKVKLRALEVAYTGAISSRAPSTGLVSLLAGATSASSDRSAKTEIFGFIGLLAGIVFGCVLAISLDWRRSTRRLSGRVDIGARTSHQV